MKTAMLHGLVVGWETRGLEVDPAERLFAGFAAAEPPASANRDLELHIEALRVLPDATGFRPSFFQGDVRVRERQGEFRILAPAATVSVSADGRRIDAAVDPSLLVERAFANTTLFLALILALRKRGLFHMHAGAFTRGEGARARRVVVMGDSGAGKSTVTLSLLDGTSRFLGDDALFLAERDGRPTLLGFPRPFHVGPATAAAFPGLALGASDAQGKRDLALASVPGQLAAQMQAPDVALFPIVTAEPQTRAIPLSAAEAFSRALRSSALVVVDGVTHQNEQLALLGGLLGRARAYELRLGADWLADAWRAPQLVPWD